MVLGLAREGGYRRCWWWVCAEGMSLSTAIAVSLQEQVTACHPVTSSVHSKVPETLPAIEPNAVPCKAVVPTSCRTCGAITGVS